MKLYKYTSEQLVVAVKESYSYRQVLIKLGVVPAGGNYQVLKRAIAHYDLDISHFTGQASNKGKTFKSKRSIEDYLSNKQTIQSYRLKKLLLKEGIFKAVCSNCGLKIWLGKPIPLELDHINGDNSDNSLCNLRLLCPNCHAQTPTYRGKNKTKA